MQMQLYVIRDSDRWVHSGPTPSLYALDREFERMKTVYGERLFDRSGRLRFTLEALPIREVFDYLFAYEAIQKPVWHRERHWYYDVGHYAHISEDDPRMIAFLDERERLVSMKPGKYLKKFFPTLSAKQIAFYAEWHAAGEKPLVDIGAELKFASDLDDIIWVYHNGPSSCMRNEDAVRVYGAGDLAVAYLERDDEVIARALCWPEKKVFGRVYPNPGEQSRDEARDHLFARLRKDGFTHTDEGGSFNGARLLKIDGGDDSVVMPYLDHCRRVDDAGDFMIMNDDGEYPAQTTCGYIDIDPVEYESCAECREDFDPDDLTLIPTIWSPQLGPHDHCSLCSYCQDNNTFWCDATSTNYYNADAVELADGSNWIADYFAEHGFNDPETGEAYPNTEGVMHRNQLYHPSSIQVAA